MELFILMFIDNKQWRPSVNLSMFSETSVRKLILRKFKFLLKSILSFGDSTILRGIPTKVLWSIMYFTKNRNNWPF